MGLPEFSLRAGSKGIGLAASPEEIREIKGDRKLYCTLNIFFHNPDLKRLEERLDYISSMPFDAIVISDIGILPLIRKGLPGIEVHLSTQANCSNWQAASFYHELGFSRIVPARELSLEEIAEIKIRVPGLELEVFVHGAMCMSYSGRCILSAEKTGRSANRGACAQNCRWKYRVYLEEESRPGEFIPVDQGQDYSALLSSKDLCMIDHVDRLREAGLDSLKIEGRMKSLYYCAMTTRAYRWAVDHPGQGANNPYRKDLFSFSHRAYGSGFYFDRMQENICPDQDQYQQSHDFLGALNMDKEGRYRIETKNSFSRSDQIELISPGMPDLLLGPGDFMLYDQDGAETEFLKGGLPGYLGFGEAVGRKLEGPGLLLRRLRS